MNQTWLQIGYKKFTDVVERTDYLDYVHEKRIESAVYYEKSKASTRVGVIFSENRKNLNPQTLDFQRLHPTGTQCEPRGGKLVRGKIAEARGYNLLPLLFFGYCHWIFSIVLREHDQRMPTMLP